MNRPAAQLLDQLGDDQRPHALVAEARARRKKRHGVANRSGDELLERGMGGSQLFVVGQHIGQARRVREEVLYERRLLVVGGKIGQVAGYGIAQVQEAPLDQHQRPEIDHRLGDRGQEKDRVSAQGRSIFLWALAAEVSRLDEFAVPADRNHAAGDRCIGPRCPLLEQVVGGLEAERIEADFFGSSIRQRHREQSGKLIQSRNVV